MALPNSFTNSEWQEHCDKFVSLHVIACQSSLVDKLLAAGDILSWEDVANRFSVLDEEDEDYEEKEVYEWWIVDGWLLDKLESKGEVVLRSDYGDWWGRGTSGQAIAMDTVIEDIVKEIL